MAKKPNQPNESEAPKTQLESDLEAELEQTQRDAGTLPEPEEDEEPETPESEDKSDKDGEGEEKPEPEKEDDKKSEEEGKEGDEKSSEDEKKEGDDSEEEKPTPTRPERYIPIPKHKQALQEKDDEIAKLNSELEVVRKESGQTKTEQEKAKDLDTEKQIEAYAEKHGMTVDAVKDLRELLGTRDNVLTPEQQAAIERSQQREREEADAQQFNTEFERDVVSLIKKRYPNATEEAIKQAKEVLDEEAHTSLYAKTPLRAVFRDIEEGSLNTILNVPKKKTSESSGGGGDKRRGGSTPQELSFAELSELDENSPEKVEAIRGMEPDTFEEYTRFVEDREGTGGSVTRDGKTVSKF